MLLNRKIYGILKWIFTFKFNFIQEETYWVRIIKGKEHFASAVAPGLSKGWEALLTSIIQMLLLLFCLDVIGYSLQREALPHLLRSGATALAKCIVDLLLVNQPTMCLLQ